MAGSFFATAIPELSRSVPAGSAIDRFGIGSIGARAKQLELEGWSYPRHLAGRVFSVIVHGDVEGAEGVRRSLADWLSFMELIPAGTKAEIDRYIGYWQPYATSHEALDEDRNIQQEVENAARTLAGYGFPHLRVLGGGFRGWKEAGLPVKQR